MTGFAQQKLSCFVYRMERRNYLEGNRTCKQYTVRREVVLLAVWLEGALDARDMRRTLCVWYERGDAEMRARMGVQVESLRVSVKHKTWCCHWTRLSIKARVSSDVFPQDFFIVWEQIQNIPTFMLCLNSLICSLQWGLIRRKLVTNLVRLWRNFVR